MSLSKGMYHDESQLPPEEDRIALIHKAFDSGVTLLSTADLYGPYDNHVLIGKAIKNYPREKVLIASKFGAMKTEGKYVMDSSPDNVRKSLEGALQRIGVNYIDLYILRSKDQNIPIEDTIKVMAELKKEGKIKGIGLSEISPADIRRAHAVHPIDAVEMEWSLFTRDAEADLVPTCRELGIAFLAYSPLGRGQLTGVLNMANLSPGDFRNHSPRFSKEALEENQKFVDKLKQLAEKKGCKPGQLALAWVHHRGDDVFPIPGTKNIKYLEENIAAFQIKLSKQELAELEEAVPHDDVAGERYPGMQFATFHYAKKD